MEWRGLRNVRPSRGGLCERGLMETAVIGFLLIPLFWAGLAVLFFWLLYQAIWRGVRRGLQEFHGRNDASGRGGDGLPLD